MKGSENTVTPQLYLREADVRDIGETEPSPEPTPDAQSSGEAAKLCAYNLTAERFLSGDVDTSQSLRSSLDGRVIAFTPGTGAALWIVPFREISPTNVRTPIDLLYLDRDLVVLDAVESFPIGRVSDSAPRPASVLVLPAHTIASGGARPGDELVLCAPEEMRRRLQLLADARAAAQAERSIALGTSSHSDVDSPTPVATGPILNWEEDPQPKPSNEDVFTETPQIETFPPPEEASSPDVVEPAQPAIKARKNWFQRMFSKDPSQPRSAPRESLSWLVAYFFTGGSPVPQEVRDVSETGLYIFTNERWYVGTVVRLTLTDRRRPSPDRSIALNARVVRFENDGVGLEFVLADGKDTGRSTDPEIIGQTVNVSKVQLQQFLDRLKSGLI